LVGLRGREPFFATRALAQSLWEAPRSSGGARNGQRVAGTRSRANEKWKEAGCGRVE
jgi:hypothetical protein